MTKAVALKLLSSEEAKTTLAGAGQEVPFFGADTSIVLMVTVPIENKAEFDGIYAGAHPDAQKGEFSGNSGHVYFLVPYDSIRSELVEKEFINSSQNRDLLRDLKKHMFGEIPPPKQRIQ